MTGLDVSAPRQELALRFDANAVYDSESSALADFEANPDRNPAVVIEATGRPGMIAPAMRMAGWMGRVVLLGSTRGAVDYVDFYGIHRKGLTIIGAHELTRPNKESRRNNWTSWDDTTAVLEFIRRGSLSYDTLITDMFSPEDAAKAYAAINNPDSSIIVDFDWTRST